ncbi:MAG: DUF448 domain-containing protein [Deltaproteobacteria bacterium]|nr:DUF448 domain-containing protein [Deltaproteobacteria bacterium]
MSRKEKKRFPERSCSVCGLKGGKFQFVRVAIRPAEETLEIDSTGFLEGRGLYVCRTQDCLGNFVKMAKRGKIKHIGKFPGRSKERLIGNIQELCAGLRKTKGVLDGQN